MADTKSTAAPAAKPESVAKPKPEPKRERAFKVMFHGSESDGNVQLPDFKSSKPGAVVLVQRNVEVVITEKQKKWLEPADDDHGRWLRENGCNCRFYRHLHIQETDEKGMPTGKILEKPDPKYRWHVIEEVTDDG